jgi:hypothetical protein
MWSRCKGLFGRVDSHATLHDRSALPLRSVGREEDQPVLKLISHRHMTENRETFQRGCIVGRRAPLHKEMSTPPEAGDEFVEGEFPQTLSGNTGMIAAHRYLVRRIPV